MRRGRGEGACLFSARKDPDFSEGASFRSSLQHFFLQFPSKVNLLSLGFIHDTMKCILHFLWVILNPSLCPNMQYGQWSFHKQEASQQIIYWTYKWPSKDSFITYSIFVWLPRRKKRRRSQESLGCIRKIHIGNKKFFDMVFVLNEIVAGRSQKSRKVSRAQESIDHSVHNDIFKARTVPQRI